MLEAMQAQGGLAARAANRHLGKSDREGAGVLSAAQRHTHFLDSPRMTAVLGHSDFTFADVKAKATTRSEEHTSELQSLMRISYAVFCLKKKITTKKTPARTHQTSNKIHTP